MSKESYTGIENYLHDLHYAKNKKNVLHSITKNLNSVLQQINLNSPHIRLSDSDFYSAGEGSESQCASTDDSCSFDISAVSDATTENGKDNKNNNHAKPSQSAESEKSSSSRGPVGFKFEVDSGESLTSTLLGSACGDKSKASSKAVEDCASSAKSSVAASSTESSINISATLDEKPLSEAARAAHANKDTGESRESRESSMSSGRCTSVDDASLSSRPMEVENHPTDNQHRIGLLENKLERQSRLLKAALGRQVELKQEAESFYLAKKQFQKQAEDTSRKYNMLKHEVAKTREENLALASELKKSKNIGREILDARRSARAALSEMATQNAKLTAMLVERKQEIRELNVQLDAFRKRGEVRDLSQDRTKAYEAEIQRLREKLRREQHISKQLQDQNQNQNHQQQQQQSQSQSSSMSDNKSEASAQSDFRFNSGGEQEVSSSAGLSTSSENASVEATPRTRMIRNMERENNQLKKENSKLKVAAEKLHKHEEKQRQRNQVEQCKQSGNNAYNAGNYKDAQAHYSTALSHNIEDLPMKAVLYCNRSAALIKLCKLIDAIADCTRAIALDRSYNRAYQRRSEAYEKIGDYKNAAKDLERYIRNLGGYEKVPSDLRRHYAMVQRRGTREIALNPYHVLGLQMGCSSSDIKTTYRKLALRYHPDKTSEGLEKSVSEGLFKIVSEAYSTLSDSDKKAKYDFQSQRRASTFF